MNRTIAKPAFIVLFAAFMTPVLVGILNISPVGASPVTYTYQGEVSSVVSFPGINVGDPITGSFTYDPDTAIGCGIAGCFSSPTWSFSSSVGPFSLTEDFQWRLIEEASSGRDLQVLEGSGLTQFGFFFEDSSETALSGNSLADLNFDLADWTHEEVRYYESFPGTGVIMKGWEGTLTNISIASVPVPEPSTLLLLAAGLGAMAWRLRKRS
jgi:hypothetical protein